jgi:hypothetical protein
VKPRAHRFRASLQVDVSGVSDVRRGDYPDVEAQDSKCVTSAGTIAQARLRLFPAYFTIHYSNKSVLTEYNSGVRLPLPT